MEVTINEKDQSQQAITQYVSTPTLKTMARYTVQFEPGSLGLNLEPVVKSTGKKIGCRAINLLESANCGKPSQAQKSRIHVGDLLINIDGENIMSKDYSDIVAVLK